MVIDLGDLTAFVAVTRGGGFRPTAGASGGSASSFSAAMSRLEARLGVPLLNRPARSVTPTEAGARLLDRLGPAHVTEAEPKSSGRKVLLPIEIGNQPGLSDRLQFYCGDFFSNPLSAADVFVMGRILHNWDLSTKKLLLGKAFQALSAGGALIVYDPLIDDERCVQAHALLSSLNMLIETAGGFEYTGAECRNWMKQAGFREIRIEPLGDLHTAVIGTKPV